MIRFAETKVNPDTIKKRVTYLSIIAWACFLLSIFLFAFMWAYSAMPEKYFFVSSEVVLAGMLVQAGLFLFGTILYIYTDKLKIVFKIDLYKTPKKGKSRAAKLRSYRIHFKKRLINFIVFEFFLVAFFITSLTVTRIIGYSIRSAVLDANNFFNSELIFLIYTIVALIAMAIDIMYVNYLIQLSAKIFKKKPDKAPNILDHYDYD